MRVTCIIVDLDGTLVYFKKGSSFFEIFIRRGVDPAVVLACCQETKEKFGFSISAMIKVVAEKVAHPFSNQEITQIEREFSDWLGHSLTPYPDSVATLTQWRRQGIPVVILTAGNSEYQTQKVQATRLPYDQLIVVSHDDRKPGAVRRLLERYGSPVLLIDDRPSVLDAMKAAGLTEDKVITVRLLRPESPYVRELSAYGHRSRHTLAEVYLLVES